MTNKQVFRGGLTVLAGIALCTVSFSSLTAQQSEAADHPNELRRR